MLSHESFSRLNWLVCGKFARRKLGTFPGSDYSASSMSSKGRSGSPSLTLSVPGGRTNSHDSLPTHEDIIPGNYEVNDDSPQTYFRTLTQSSVKVNPQTETDQERRQRILNRRGTMVWLPMHGFDNDLVYAMWWFVWGSAFTTIIPVLPLVAMLENVLWETPSSVLSKSEHIGLYGIMIFCGVCWTLASWIFGRAVETEAVKPLLGHIWCCSTDELLSTWIMFLGIAPTIAVFGVYLHHSPENLEWRLGLLGSIICTFATLVFVYFFLPRKRKEPYRNIISPLLTCCCFTCPRNSIRKHFQNDLLVLCWFSVAGCAVCVVVSFFLSIYSIYMNQVYAIYEYITFFMNCLMFQVGCMYFTAGSYPEIEGRIAEENGQPPRGMAHVGAGKGPIVPILTSGAAVAVEV